MSGQMDGRMDGPGLLRLNLKLVNVTAGVVEELKKDSMDKISKLVESM